MSDDPGRALGCPACGGTLPRDRHTCAECWREVPLRLRMALVMSHRTRIRNYARYAEALAALLQWCHDQRVREWAVSSWVVDPVVEVKR